MRSHLSAPLHSHFGCFKVDLDASPHGESFEHAEITAGLTPAVPALNGWATKFVKRTYPPTETTYLPNPARPAGWILLHPIT